MEKNRQELEQLGKSIESINNYIKSIGSRDDEEKREAYKYLGQLSGAFIQSIDDKEQTEWEKSKREISAAIRNDLSRQLVQYKKDYVNYTRKTGDFYFLDYCNCIKSLLAIYNFGSTGNISEQDKARDKADIKEGIVTILSYIGDDNRYDISSETMISGDDCREILLDADDNNIPVTLSLATVMTTLTYLRRAMNRNGLFTKDELNDVRTVFYDKYEKDKNNERIQISLYDKLIETYTEILAMLYGYVSQGDNRYQGWGFTLKSKAVNLSDTYAVVDAISRFLDAFTKDDKLDKEFTDALDAKFKNNLDHYAGYGYFKDTNISEKILDAMYNVAFVTYEQTKNVYGGGIFYAEGQDYSETSYEQIANSNRSSALFNPLYVAMITMYGYNEKEVVIRKFMDDIALMTKYYKQYEGLNPDGTPVLEDSEDGKEKKEVVIPEEDKISTFARTLDWFNDNEYKNDFNGAIRGLYFSQDAAKDNRGARKSTDYNSKWRRYYNVARVFQKYLEKKHPEELLEIAVYREYMNATRDAIDQVQVMYRKFNDSQKLGIVDTDYQMFNRLDIDAEPSTLSKLNKANIAVNSLRPMLLSAKILIVSALIKYPQKDMEELYEAIKASKYTKRVRDKKKTDVAVRWLWNEDRINMNSTARHCEAIMYDYFDYFEKYELGFRAIRRIKSDVDDLTTKNVNSQNGTLNPVDGGNPFVNLVMEMTQSNLGSIQNAFNAGKEQMEKDHESDLRKTIGDYEELLKTKNTDIKKLEDEKRKQESDILIGEKLKEWIREETENYLTETLSYIILRKLNFNGYDFDDITDSLKTRLFYCKFAGAKNLADNLKDGLTDSDKQNVVKAKAKVKALESSAEKLTGLFEGAFNGIIDTDEVSAVRNMLKSDYSNFEYCNAQMTEKFAELKANRLKEKVTIEKEKPDSDKENK